MPPARGSRSANPGEPKASPRPCAAGPGSSRPGPQWASGEPSAIGAAAGEIRAGLTGQDEASLTEELARGSKTRWSISTPGGHGRRCAGRATRWCSLTGRSSRRPRRAAARPRPEHSEAENAPPRCERRSSSRSSPPRSAANGLASRTSWPASGRRLRSAGAA